MMGAISSSNIAGKKKKWATDIFLIFVYVISLLVDLYNGYVQQILHSETIIPIVYKGGVLAVCLCVIFKNSAVIKYAFLFVLCYLCCIGHWVVNGYALTGMALVDDLSRLLYPYVILAYLVTHASAIDKMQLLRYMMYGSLFAAVVIVVTSLLGIGVNSYGDDYGYGTKGFFRAGNDISLVLVMGNVLVSYFMTVTPRFFYFLYSLLFTAACMMVGSTAGILGAFLNYFFLLSQLLLVKKQRFARLYKIFCLVIVIVGIPFLVNWTTEIINTDTYTIQKFDKDRILSGGSREFLRDAYLNVREKFTLGDHIWGVGYQELGRRVGADLGLGASRVVELNQYEMTGYYGWILGGFILLVPIVYFVKYGLDFGRRRTSFSYWMTIAIGLFVMHGFIAGHAYNNIQAMTMLVGILFLYQYRQVVR